MPDFDSLEFAISFALKLKSGGAAKKAICSLTEDELHHLAKTVADHLRLCRWRQLPPDPPATDAQFPRVRQD